MTSRGETAVSILRAVIDELPFEDARVEDNDRNRQLYAETATAVAELPPGVMPDIPADWNHEPDLAVNDPGIAEQVTDDYG